MLYRNRYTKYLGSVMGCVLLGVSGCSTLGPSAVRGDRPEYNRAIQQTEKEELLLNIVRTRYGENIKFLQVASIVSSLNIGAALNANIPFGKHSRLEASAATNSLGLGVNYGEMPTITYIPVEGQQFATQFLTGISVNTLQVLLQSGWYIDQVLTLVVERMGALINDPGAPTFPQFVQLSKILRQIQSRGDLKFVWLPQVDTVLADKLPPSAVNTKVFSASGALNWLRYYPRSDGNYKLAQLGIAVVMEIQYTSQEEAQQVSILLGNVSTRPKGALIEHIELASATAPPSDFSQGEPVTQIPMNLRSFSDMLYSVMAGVAVPPEDATATFSMDTAAAQLINIPQSNSYPSKAFVAIPYRGKWFFIADTDLNSKATFSLLLNILSLQTTGGGAAPGLSLSIGN